MENTVTTLKTQLNYLLNEVVGIEHNIDDLHSYDDSNLKTQLNNLSTTIETYNENMSEIRDRTETLEIKTSDISHPDNATLISNSIQAIISTSPNLNDNINAHSQLKLLPTSLNLGVIDSGIIPGQINIINNRSNSKGINIMSGMNIDISTSNGQHYLRINPNTGLTVTDINGLKISFNDSGITLTKTDDSKTVLLPWS
jgi:hypothetical protein